MFVAPFSLISLSLLSSLLFLSLLSLLCAAYGLSFRFHLPGPVCCVRGGDFLENGVMDLAVAVVGGIHFFQSGILRKGAAEALDLIHEIAHLKQRAKDAKKKVETHSLEGKETAP